MSIESELDKLEKYLEAQDLLNALDALRKHRAAYMAMQEKIELEHVESHADDYSELSHHYMTPEQISEVPYPPRDDLHAVYATAHALVSERHAKGDLVRMVYALLVKSDERVRGTSQ
jgi:hypothetical protein